MTCGPSVRYDPAYLALRQSREEDDPSLPMREWERPLKRADLDDFVACYGRKHHRHEREETERFRRFAYDDLAKRDKLNLDIFWLKDASVTDPDTLPPLDEIAAEIVDSLETALEKFRAVAAKLG